MARVRQQGYRPCVDARTGLKDDKQEIEDDSRHKRGACAIWAMMVVMMVTMMTLATVMVVVMVAMTVVVVMISHLLLL
jgi:hypothetical protein